ncbi:50S ribosomal protein L6, partial [Candidatus Saccharibacteria bacterium]|nr:50S ribosomal protein L6 [Candidatus Saccharibacteria bacterium]
MSRVGRTPITVPSGVSVTIADDAITVSGSKGTLSQFTMPDISVKQEGEHIIVSRANDQPKVRAKHGLMRALLNNMVVGVDKGFSKKL